MCAGCDLSAAGIVPRRNLGQKSVPEGRDSQDISRLAGVVVEHPAKLRYGAREGIVGDSDVVPDRRYDFFLAHDPAGIPEQE